MLKVGDRVRLPGTFISPPQASSKLGKVSKSKRKGLHGLTTRVRVGLGRVIPKGPFRWDEEWVIPHADSEPYSVKSSKEQSNINNAP